MNNDIRQHMIVRARGETATGGLPGIHVGNVDRVEGDFIKITKNNSPDGRHHWIPLEWVDAVNEDAVFLNKTVDQFQQGAMTANPQQVSGAGGTTGAAAGAGGMTSAPRGTSSTRDNSLADVSTQGGNAMDPTNLVGGQLSGTMNPTSGQGETLSTAGDPRGPLSGGALASGERQGEEKPAPDRGQQPTGKGSVTASGRTANRTGTGAPNLGDVDDTTSRSSLASDPSHLPSTMGGTVTGPPTGMNSGGEAPLNEGLTGSGGTVREDTPRDGRVADRTTGRTGSRDADRGVLRGDVANRKSGRTDTYTAAGTGDSTKDRELMSNESSGPWGDRNSQTGASGNVSAEDGLPGQGRDTTSGSFLSGRERNERAAQEGGDRDGGEQVKGMEGYDTSYSGGSSAMPGKGGQPTGEQEGRLDGSLSDNDRDRDAQRKNRDKRR